MKLSNKAIILRSNRRNMKQHKYHNKQQQQQHRAGGGAGGGNTSSSSPQATTVRSLVDVADSSDEPRFARKGWSSGGTRGTLAPQKNRDMLDTLPPTSGDDLDMEMDVNGAPIDENARAQLRAGDYKQLSQFPSMGGGHFTFGVEKEWSNSAAQGQTQAQQAKPSRSYFTLNLSLLSCGLQTIPFYKRMDYPTSMFTRPQIVAQTEAAERAERIYQERVLRELNPNHNGNATSPKSRVASASGKSATKVEETPAEPDELDELLAMTNTQLEQTSLANTATPTLPFVAIPAVVRPTTATPSSAPKNDVEQWLDSVLDE